MAGFRILSRAVSAAILFAGSALAGNAQALHQLRAPADDDRRPGNVVEDVSTATVAALRGGLDRIVIVSFSKHATASTVTGMAIDSASTRTLQAAKLALLKRSTLSALTDHGILIVQDFDQLALTAVRLRSSDDLAFLRSLSEVDGIYDNHEHHMTGTPNLDLIGQPTVAASGFLGSGTSVAVLDGAADYTNPAFGCSSPGTPSSCPIEFTQTFGTGGSAAANLHATNVAGIVHAVAPMARIAALDVFSGDSAMTTSIAGAINWCINNKAAYNIVAVNASLGSGQNFYPCDNPDPAEAAASALRAVGITPVFSAGNDGFGTALESPACAPSAISVGAVYSQAFGSFTWPEAPGCTDSVTSVDLVPCFSDSANFLSMLAPGAPITAAGSTFDGTSQAAPHVSGSVAVLRSAYPADSIGTTVNRMIQSAPDVTDPGSGVTTPRLSLSGAVFGPYATCIPVATVLPISATGNLLSRSCSLGDTLDRTYYANFYQFTGTAGQSLAASVSSNVFEPYLDLVSPAGTSVAFNYSSPSVNRTAHLATSLTSTGLWTIRVSSYWPLTSGAFALTASSAAAGAPCAPSSTTLCLNGGRFKVSTDWQSTTAQGHGTAVPMTADTGYFWFFSASNVEMVVKAVNGCGFNSKYWVFAGGLTNVMVTTTVTDTATGNTKVYSNPQGTAFQPLQDTAAFACP